MIRRPVCLDMGPPPPRQTGPSRQVQLPPTSWLHIPQHISCVAKGHWEILVFLSQRAPLPQLLGLWVPLVCGQPRLDIWMCLWQVFFMLDGGSWLLQCAHLDHREGMAWLQAPFGWLHMEHAHSLTVPRWLSGTYPPFLSGTEERKALPSCRKPLIWPQPYLAVRFAGYIRG